MNIIRIARISSQIADVADRGSFVATDPPVVKAADEVRSDSLRLAQSVGQLRTEIRSSWRRSKDR